MKKSSKLLTDAMNRLGINKSELSEKSGVAYTTVLNMLSKGIENARLQNVFSVCRVLGINPEDLIYIDDIPAAEEPMISKDELRLIDAYKTAHPITQQNIRKILDIPTPKRVFFDDFAIAALEGNIDEDNLDGIERLIDEDR